MIGFRGEISVARFYPKWILLTLAGIPGIVKCCFETNCKLRMGPGCSQSVHRHYALPQLRRGNLGLVRIWVTEANEFSRHRVKSNA
jgi:hypothetical protein